VTLVYNSTTVVASKDLKNAEYTAAGWVIDLADVSTK
jgi:peptide/nickel transport system substrate-binding protein